MVQEERQSFCDFISREIKYAKSNPKQAKSHKDVTGLLRGIHRSPVNSPHKWPVARKMFPFDDVIMFRRDPLLQSAT